MTVKTTIAAALVALATAAAAPANAGSLTVSVGDGAAALTIANPAPRHWGPGWQHGWNPGWHRTLSPQEVRRVLRDRGFREIRYLDRRGTIYQVHAVDYRHKHIGLIVSARNGSILSYYRVR
jgi:hypothetical protein